MSHELSKWLEVGGTLTLTMQPVGARRVRLRPTVLAPALKRSLDRHTLPAFDGMNRALKTRAARGPAARAG